MCTDVVYLPVQQPAGTPEEAAELEQLQAEAWRMFLDFERVGNEMKQLTPAQRQEKLHNFQDQLIAMKNAYQDYTLEFKALHLAFECVRIAWYAVGQDESGCHKHLGHLDGSVAWLVSHLLPEVAA